VSQVLAHKRNIDRKRERNLVDMGLADELSTEACAFEFQIPRNITRCIFNRLLDSSKLLSFRFERNRHSRFDFKGAAINFPSIDTDVAMGDQLLCSKNRWGKPKAINDVV
jgi:ribosomal protein S26